MTFQRHVAFERLHNFRDLGGYRSRDGRAVRPHRLFRSDSLAKLDDADWPRFTTLGIKTVIDLRYPWEIAARGRVRSAPGLTYHNLSIEHRPYDQAALTPDIEPAPYLADRFAEVLDDGVAELAQVLRLIAAAGNAPLVFHCASGKDRTGIVAALVLGLLDVPEDDIVADFALTGLATERLTTDWRAQNPGRPLIWPGHGQAPPELMRRFLADVTDRYGSIAAYARDRLQLTDDEVAALGDACLDPPPHRRPG